MHMKLRLAMFTPLALVLGLILPLAAPSAASAATAGVTYHFPAPPIANAGSIGPGQSVTFIARVLLNGAADPGAVVYLGYFQGGHVTGDSTGVPATQCGGVSQLPADGSLIPCSADPQGKVALTYTVPAQPPAQGRADWVAEASPSSKQHAVEHYVYTTVYRFSSSPIALSGSLLAGATVPVTLTAKDGLNNPMAGSQVYLSFRAAAGGGSAAVGSTKLTGTPSQFTTDSSGSLQITYTTPALLLASGADSIMVQDLAHLATETSSDSYAFAASTPVVSVGDVTVIEGDQDPGIPAQFTVTISPVQTNPVTVQYKSLCGIGDKGCGEDFLQVFTPVTVTIPANTSSTSVLVRQFAYIGAHAGETYNEGYYVHLLNPSVGVLGRAVGTGMLLPDVEGTNVALPYLYAGSAGVVPTNGGAVPLYFTVTLGAQQSGTVSFHYATANGSAIAGTDYAATSGTASIPAGQTSAVVKVNLLPSGPPGSNKTFSLTISNAGGITISGASGTGTILAG